LFHSTIDILRPMGTGSANCYKRDFGQSGQGMAEFIIVVVLVSIIVIAAIRYFGFSITNQFSNASREISTLGEIGPENVIESSSSGDSSRDVSPPKSSSALRETKVEAAQTNNGESSQGQ